MILLEKKNHYPITTTIFSSVEDNPGCIWLILKVL